MDAETAVERVQRDAATEAAGLVAGAVASEAAVVASEVADVGAVLEEHVEATEVEHEEILEGNEWLKKQLELLLQSLATFQATVLSTVAANQAAVMTELGTLRQSTVTTPIVPVVAELPIVEAPPDVAVDLEVPETPIAAEPARRKRRVI